MLFAIKIVNDTPIINDIVITYGVVIVNVPNPIGKSRDSANTYVIIPNATLFCFLIFLFPLIVLLVPFLP